MKNKLTILSFGIGQDSTAILLKLIYDEQFRKKYAPGKLWVITADTKNEHNESYLHLSNMMKLCYDKGIPLYLLDPEKYANKSWKGGLVKFYESGNRIGSKCFPKSCSDNLKIKPIYEFIDQHIHESFNTVKVGRKAAIKEFASENGRIDVLIGIAKGEEKRASTNEESPHKWMRQSINKVYPLIELGMDRQACQDYIKSVGHNVPIPSNCILCPFMSEQELLYLYKAMPIWYDKWVELEANKIQANLHMGNRNMGVWGEKLLPEKLEDAKKKYGHMTMEELHEYKMSHGHCVKSKY